MGRDERYSELTDILQEAAEDISKFYQKGNKAAGTRARKKMQRLKKKAQQVRMEIQNIKKEEL